MVPYPLTTVTKCAILASVCMDEKGGRSVLPTEMVILAAMAETGGIGKESSLDEMTGGCIGRLYLSLVTRGYIKKKGLEGYQLTPKGGAALIEFLYKNEARVRQAIKVLERLRIERGRQKNKIKQEVEVC